MKWIWIILLVLYGCGEKEHTLKVAATATPHAEILEFIQPEMEKKGIHLEIIIVDDYQLPNRLLAEKEVDANYFQHLPFLQSQEELYGKTLVPIAAIHCEPLGIYSRKITSLNELKTGDRIAIPSDPSNEGRALLFLSELGVIHLKGKGMTQTLRDVSDNPKSLSIKEIDTPFLARALDDVTLAVIPGNFALRLNLEPIESERCPLLYQNLLVVRQGDENRSDMKLLVEALQSEELKNFILSKYKGKVCPTF